MRFRHTKSTLTIAATVATMVTKIELVRVQTGTTMAASSSTTSKTVCRRLLRTVQGKLSEQTIMLMLAVPQFLLG